VEAPSGEHVRGKGSHGCSLQVKLCNPCLSALEWFVYRARCYTSALLFALPFIHFNGFMSMKTVQFICCISTVVSCYHKSNIQDFRC